MHPLCLLLALVSHFGFPSSVFSHVPFCWAHPYLLGFLHWVNDVVFVCFDLGLFLFIFFPPPFGSVTCPEPASLLTNPVTFLWFICFRDSCFFSRAMLLSWLAECKCKITQKNISSVYSQCSCRLVYSDPLLEEIRPHWAWLGSMVISGSHLEMLFTVPCGSITI